MRLAWFSPLPPSRSGIAAYSAELIAELGRRHEIDAFVDVPARAATPAIAGAQGHSAHDFVWRHAQHPYDLAVYQLGNDISHDYMWPYLVRYPGLVVLHDGQVHQARAKALTWKQDRAADYRAEFAYSHPDAPSAVADLVVAGLGGALCRLWPMVRVPLESARMAAVHNARLAADLRETVPGRSVVRIRMGVPDPLAAPRASRDAVRARHGVPAGAIVFAAFGRVTPEKQVTTALEALAQTGTEAANAHMLMVGEQVGYYDVRDVAGRLGVESRVTWCGYVADEQLPEYLDAADVGLCLRWPTSRETSASWLRCVAAGKPTMVHDLAHTGDIPLLDARWLSPLRCTGGGLPAQEPIGLAVGLDDELEGLTLGIRHLARNAVLRAGLGAAARAWWSKEATMACAVADYEAALQTASRTHVDAPAGWPAHLRADGTERAREIATSMGLELGWIRRSPQ